ncbi:MAG: SHOCT domain-containing protein [Ardenticatenaceae bacterium]|nr:SHOCT domain-containing protein [Ardenticatenaceae bacterium]
MWWGDGFGWGWMMFGGVMMLLFWGGVIALIVFAVRSFSSPRQSGGYGESGGGSRRTALDILKERYARGEITKAEYEEMRRDLEL